MTGRKKSEANQSTNTAWKEAALLLEIESYKLQNKNLTKSLENCKLVNKTLDADRNALNQENLQLSIQNYRLIAMMGKINAVSKKMFPHLLSMSDDLQELLNLSTTDPLHDVSLGRRPLEVTRREQTPVQRNVIRTANKSLNSPIKMVKPMVAGHIIEYPTINLRRVPTEHLQHLANTSVEFNNTNSRNELSRNALSRNDLSRSNLSSDELSRSDLSRNELSRPENDSDNEAVTNEQNDLQDSNNSISNSLNISNRSRNSISSSTSSNATVTSNDRRLSTVLEESDNGTVDNRNIIINNNNNMNVYLTPLSVDEVHQRILIQSDMLLTATPNSGRSSSSTTSNSSRFRNVHQRKITQAPSIKLFPVDSLVPSSSPLPKKKDDEEQETREDDSDESDDEEKREDNDEDKREDQSTLTVGNSKRSTRSGKSSFGLLGSSTGRGKSSNGNNQRSLSSIGMSTRGSSITMITDPMEGPSTLLDEMTEFRIASSTPYIKVPTKTEDRNSEENDTVKRNVTRRKYVRRSRSLSPEVVKNISSEEETMSEQKSPVRKIKLSNNPKKSTGKKPKYNADDAYTPTVKPKKKKSVVRKSRSLSPQNNDESLIETALQRKKRLLKITVRKNKTSAGKRSSNVVSPKKTTNSSNASSTNEENSTLKTKQSPTRAQRTKRNIAKPSYAEPSLIKKLRQ